MRKGADPSKTESWQPSTDEAEIVDFVVDWGLDDDMEMPGPVDFEYIHGYSIDEEE